MNIPPKYEDVLAKLEAAQVEIKCLKAVLNGMEFKQVDDMVLDGVDTCLFLGQESARIIKGIQAERDSLREELERRTADLLECGTRRKALQQRLTVAERRESEAREELLELSRKLDVFYSRSHGIKNLSEIEKANDEAKNLKLKVREYEDLLNISKELLTTISRHGATTKPVDWCDSFKAEVADRIEKIGAALKPAEGEGS